MNAVAAKEKPQANHLALFNYSGSITALEALKLART